MNIRLLIVPFFLLASTALAADLSTIPARSLAKKKELLFSDNFQSAVHDKRWRPVVDTFVIENGVLKGSPFSWRRWSSTGC